MAFLHNRKIIHFDIKCENLLCDLSDINKPIIKIADVGLSKKKLKSFISCDLKGTLPWMAPELFPKITQFDYDKNYKSSVNEKVNIIKFNLNLQSF